MSKIPLEDKQFEEAIAFVLANEGGYVNDKDDKGGETKYGISKRSYPNVDIASLTIEQAKIIYREDFWDKQNYNKIKDGRVATKILDIAVNIGPFWANSLLQRALRAAGKKNVNEDGILGAITIAAVNSADPLIIIAALRSETAGYYRTLAAVKKERCKFLKGWLNRAYV